VHRLRQHTTLPVNDRVYTIIGRAGCCIAHSLVVLIDYGARTNASPQGEPPEETQ